MSDHDPLCDRDQITRLLYRYARAIDGKDFDRLREIFTSDALIHYDVPGGTKQSLPEMIAWLREALQIFYVTQHVMSNPMIEIDEDTALSTCYLVASHEQVGLDGRRTSCVDHGVYADQLVRTPGGWRIAQRTLRRFLTRGEFQAPDAVQRFPRPPFELPG